MTNFEFLKKYFKLQNGVFTDKLIELGFATMAYSKADESAFGNLALVNDLLLDSQISVVEEKFKELDRKSTFYFENHEDLKSFAEKLTNNGYKKSFEDSWQFWQGEVIDKKHFESIKKVTSDDELVTFLKIFDSCYQKDDPKNPYGELGDFLKVSEKAWRENNTSGRLEYFVVYKGTKPVAVSALTNYEGVGYISSVGSLKEVRGEGFGKAATLYCVEESIKNGNSECSIATEEGGYPNEFYKRIGFSTRFTALGYTKD